MGIATKLKTFLNFTKNIKTTGAVYKTSKGVEKEITSKLNEQSKIVIEFGMGYGNITTQILKRLPPDAKLYSFEVNEEFCETVRETIKDNRLQIINDSAENFKKYIDQPIDNIVSSIPITIIPNEVVFDILSQAKNSLTEDGNYSQILYSKLSDKNLRKVFDSIDIKTIPINIPPAFIYHCK